ncbi:MAG: SDR family oxidoreductase [Acidimicrobiia bacterium]|nr:SDR family oxidoreductase [Acidimicrobiia bacterium]
MVGFLDRDADALQESIRLFAPRAFALVADVRDEESVEGAFADVRRQAGRLDALVNCAAVQLVGRDTTAHELDITAWNETIAVNLTGIFLCCKHGIRMMLDRGGAIVNCGSPTALRGMGGGFPAYSASKGGVHAFTRVLAAEYGRHQIRVNTLVPGATDTQLTAALFADPQVRAQIAGRTPLGRIAQPDDYVGMAVYLASDESAYVTGAEFIVDGGRTIV